MFLQELLLLGSDLELPSWKFQLSISNGLTRKLATLSPERTARCTRPFQKGFSAFRLVLLALSGPLYGHQIVRTLNLRAEGRILNTATCIVRTQCVLHICDCNASMQITENMRNDGRHAELLILNNADNLSIQKGVWASFERARAFEDLKHRDVAGL